MYCRGVGIDGDSGRNVLIMIDLVMVAVVLVLLVAVCEAWGR